MLKPDPNIGESITAQLNSRLSGLAVQLNFPLSYNIGQCEQIGRFFALWANF